MLTRKMSYLELFATIDLSVYPLPPVEQILSFFVWMMQDDAVNLETI